jgi:hypothetical protein
VVFFLISDIGWEDMLALLVAHGGHAAALPPHLLSQRVKAALDAQWQRLRCGKMIDTVVPFLPLSQADMREVLDVKLTEMSEEHAGRLWARLETTEEVRAHLVQKPFVKYVGYGLEDEGESEDEGEGGGVGEGKDCRAGKEVYWYAEFGARNLQTGGPLHALESAIVENMKPWRPLEVLDVRLNGQTGETELRWCPRETWMGGKGGEGGAGTASPLWEEAGATGCDLRWAGDLKLKVG